MYKVKWDKKQIMKTANNGFEKGCETHKKKTICYNSSSIYKLEILTRKCYKSHVGKIKE